MRREPEPIGPVRRPPAPDAACKLVYSPRRPRPWRVVRWASAGRCWADGDWPGESHREPDGAYAELQALTRLRRP